MPGSPLINSTRRCPPRACAKARCMRAISSSRPTSSAFKMRSGSSCRGLDRVTISSGAVCCPSPSERLSCSACDMLRPSVVVGARFIAPSLAVACDSSVGARFIAPITVVLTGPASRRSTGTWPIWIRLKSSEVSGKGVVRNSSLSARRSSRYWLRASLRRPMRA